MTNEFTYNGHTYQVVPIEGTTDCTIIKDGRQSRRVSESIAKNAMQYVDKLFKG